MKVVSVIVPCFNEERTINLLLDAINNQTYPKKDLEVIIADGLSKDRTREEILSFLREHPDLKIKIVDNPKRNIPAGLNIGIKHALGEIIVRLDAHSVPEDDYIERCVDALETRKGDNVGGIWSIQEGGEHWIARSIAKAASHPIGVGDARYRVGGQPQYVDTVPFGAFYKKLVNKIGGFEETLLSNEDYEFNTRIRQEGGKVWFDPSIVSHYYARSTLRELGRQYWRYGYWKYKMLRRYPKTLKWRQGLPPLFVFSLFLLSIFSLFVRPLRYVFLLEVVLYLGSLIFVGIQTALRERDLIYLIGVPLAIITMHFSWGAAFLWSMFESFVHN